MKKIKENPRVFWFTIIMIVVVACVTTSIFFRNNKKITNKISSYSEQYVRDVMNENADNIGIRITATHDKLSLIAANIAKYNRENGEEILEYLNTQESVLKRELDLVYPDGEALVGKIECKDLMEENFIKEAFEGKKTVSDIVTSLGQKEEEILFAVPVKNHKKEVTSILLCAYTTNQFTELIGQSVFDGKADAFVVKKDGTLVAKPKAVMTSNFFSLLNVLVPDQKQVIKEIQTSIKSGKTGVISLGKNQYKRYICYTKLNQNDWYEVTVMTAKTVESKIDGVSQISVRTQLILVGVLVFLAGYLFLVFIFFYRKNRIGYRRYNIITNQSQDVIFEYDPSKQTCTLNDAWNESFGKPIFMKKFLPSLIEDKTIHPEDVELFESVFEELRNGAETTIKIVRLKDQTGQYKKYQFKGTSLHNRRKDIYKVIGRLREIYTQEMLEATEAKIEELKLQKKAGKKSK